MSKELNIKIFVTYKEKHQHLKSDIITPIQTGRAIAKQDFEDMIGDDTGDNISILNNSLCELSAIYWVWKHFEEIDNPNYIGFMHYRRHFVFGKKKYVPNFYGLVKFPEINHEYLTNDLTTDQNIRNVILSYDAIIPNKIDVKETTNFPNNYEHYKHFHHIEDYNKVVEIIKHKTPEMMKYVQKYDQSTEAYFLNMFVFKKDIFFDYCNWIFPILFELKEQININMRDKYQERVLGFIAERLTGIYIYRLLDNSSLKIKHLPVSFIENVDNSGLSVVKEKNIIPIVVACSNEYVPQCSVFAQSVLEHSNKNYIYEFNVLEHTIEKDQARLLAKQFRGTNIRFQFIDIGGRLNSFENLCINRHYSSETFARYFIPNLLKKYDKCIYCDLDIIVQNDLKKIYDLDLDNKSLAVCRDWVFDALAKNEDIAKYTLNKLGLNSIHDYFQGGVQLINLKKMRETNSEEHLLQLTQELEVLFADQCIYNHYFKNDIIYLPREWNYQINDCERKQFNLLNILDVDVLQEVLNASQNACIIHYSGGRKPWYYPDEDMAHIWWKYARKTPFYEEILARMVEFKLGNSKFKINEDLIKNLYTLDHLSYFKMKKIWYKLKKYCYFNVLKKTKYEEKYKEISKKIKQARSVKRWLKR